MQNVEIKIPLSGCLAAGARTHVFTCDGCTLLGCYTAYNDNYLPTFQENPSVRDNGTGRLSRNVGKELDYTLGNIPKDRNSHLLRGASLKSRVFTSVSLAKAATAAQRKWSTLRL
jgi:hypothetical protein